MSCTTSVRLMLSDSLNMKEVISIVAKTEKVVACVEPDLKAKAESIMTELGISHSVVINMLYKQIIMIKSVSFKNFKSITDL